MKFIRLLLFCDLILAWYCQSFSHTYHHHHHRYNNNNLSLQKTNHEEGSSSSGSHNGSIRLNKVFKATHSRRAAENLIASGRVCVNGVQVTSGLMVVPYVDQIALDGKLVTGWEAMNAIYDNNSVSKSTTKTIMNNDNERTSRNHKNKGTKNKLNSEQFEYVKYYKPLGVICTTDSSIKNNIIFSLTKVHLYSPRHRIYPVGRLDKETSGLIILTSDGQVVNSALRGENKQSKVYHVTVNGNLQESHLQRLRDGVVIKTVAQRKGRTEGENTLIAKTRPCKVSRISSSYNGEKNYKKNECQITLVEGRNRQIRKMMEVLGFQVIKLRRVEFLGIQLTGGSNGLRKPGDWAILDDDELRMLQKAMDSNTDS